MEDLEIRFLTPRVVSQLTGLSGKALRRLAERSAGRSRRPRSRAQSPASRLYSWREVEEIQTASHLLKTRRLSMEEIGRILEHSHAASLDRDWVIARPKPKPLRRSPRGAGGDGRPAGSVRRPARRAR